MNLVLLYLMKYARPVYDAFALTRARAVLPTNSITFANVRGFTRSPPAPPIDRLSRLSSCSISFWS
jgi:hypothetical protein